MSCKLDSDCSNHGICNQRCQCFKNYSNNNCENCASEQYLQVNGFCLKKCENTCGDNYKCQQKLCQCIDSKANPDKNCQSCLTSFHMTDKGCYPQSCVKSHKICGNTGKCVKKQGVDSCICDEQFTGTYCENCKNGMAKTPDGKCIPEECVDPEGNECSGAGKCDKINNECKCEYGYAGRSCGECNVGFTLNFGQCISNNCYGPDLGKPCSSNGICVDQGLNSACQCEISASGQFCEICENGFKLLKDGYCLPKSCEANGVQCGERGKCVETDGIFACECEVNYDKSTNCLNCSFGFQQILGQCVSDSCVQYGINCGNRGHCELKDVVNDIHKCVCQEGYDGMFCEKCDTSSGFIRIDRGQCVQPNCIANNTLCNNNGFCQESSSGWACKCREGSNGKFCDKCDINYVKTVDNLCLPSDCVENDLQCNGNGNCVKLKCLCNGNFDIKTKCKDCIQGFELTDGVCVPQKNKFSVGVIAGIVMAILILIGGGTISAWTIIKSKKSRPVKISDIHLVGN